MRLGFINGCFDVLHVAHVRMLKFAKSKCDYLLVALDEDERIAKAKGTSRPFNNLEDRIEMIRAIRFVDEVRSFSTDSQLRSLVNLYQPDVMIIGSDWQGKEIIGSEHAKEVVYFGRIDGYSTTRILQSSSDR
tara:strand:+ start:9674 stop:10072 length:399 start_codon:yes stop_codon:yes gene_type:complete